MKAAFCVLGGTLLTLAGCGGSSNSSMQNVPSATVTTTSPASSVASPALSVQTATTSITPGFDTPTPDAVLPTTGKALPWYVALEVGASPPGNDGQASSVLNGTRARSAWAQVVRALGADNGDDSYSFVFNATINGVNLPPITALQLTHKKSGGIFGLGGSEEVDVSTKNPVYSPWVAIDSGSKISVSATHAGSSDPNFTLLQDAADFSAKVGAGTGLAVAGGATNAPASNAALALFAGALQNAYTAITTFKVNTNWGAELYPFSGTAPGGYSFVMRDVDGNAIANIEVKLAFRRTLRVSPEFIDNPNYPDMSQYSLDSPSFVRLDASGATPAIQDSLAANTSLSHELNQPSATVSDFTSACSSFRAFLNAAGLNQIDSVFFATRYLAGTLNSRPDLASVFWSRCLPQSEKIADAIGVGKTIRTAKPLDINHSLEIGAFVDRKGVDASPNDALQDADVAGMLAQAVGWQGNVDPMTREAAVNQLKTVVATSYHCNFSVSPLNPATDRFGVTMFLRNGTQSDMVLALYGPVGGDQNAQANQIEYRKPTSAEFSACTSYENSRHGTPPISGNN